MTSSITTDDLTMDTEVVPVPHPGEILEIEFLEPLSISRYRLAKEIHTTTSQVSKVIRGHIRLSPSMALKLAAYFGTSPEFWLGLQEEHDLWLARQTTKTSDITPWHERSA